MDKMRAPLDLSACVNDTTGLVRNSLIDFWGTNASSASFEEEFVANGLSIIERDEKSLLAKNLLAGNFTLDGIENSDISWQISGDISLYRSDCSLRKGNRSIGDSSIQGVPDNTTLLRSMLGRISEESETARSSVGSGSTKSSGDSYLTALSQGSGSSQGPSSNGLKDDFKDIDFSTDWRSAVSFLKSQPGGDIPSEKFNFTAEFNDKDLSFLSKRPSGNSDRLTTFEPNPALTSFCSKGGIDEESVLDLSNMSQVLRRLKKIPNDVSGTDIADMLVPPPDGVSTKARLAKHPEVTEAVPSMEEILKMMHDMKSASPATFVDGLLNKKDRRQTTKSPEESASVNFTSRSESNQVRDKSTGPKNSLQSHKMQLKTRKLNDNLLATSSTSSKSRQLSEDKSQKAWR